MGMIELQSFIDRGGWVLLYAIIPVTFFMWALILERLFYFRLAHKSVANTAIDTWNARTDKRSVQAHWVRERLISEVRAKTEQNVTLTKAFVALAPLLGLLGTVTGMISVFDAVALTGGADARALSEGVSQATIPTMAGMVASISGILFTSGMDEKASRLVQDMSDHMEIS